MRQISDVAVAVAGGEVDEGPARRAGRVDRTPARARPIRNRDQHMICVLWMLHEAATAAAAVAVVAVVVVGGGWRGR